MKKACWCTLLVTFLTVMTWLVPGLCMYVQATESTQSVETVSKDTTETVAADVETVAADADMAAQPEQVVTDVSDGSGSSIMLLMGAMMVLIIVAVIVVVSAVVSSTTVIDQL